MKRENILCIRKHSAIYIGELGPTHVHRHGAPVLLIGLSGRIRIEAEGGLSVDCRSALIDAEVAHRLDPQGERLATIYLEIDAPETQMLRATYLKGRPYAFDITVPSLIGRGNESLIHNLELDRLLGAHLTPRDFQLDPRIVRCLEWLNAPQHFSARQSEAANSVHLSTSRLNHLFKQSTGVSYRRYRMWSQLAYFMRNVKQTGSLTQSALNSGFSDAAHLSNSYQKMFGITPSALIRGLDRFEVP